MSDLNAAEKAFETFGAEWIQKVVTNLSPLLYHYTTVAGMRGIIQSGRMRAHNIGNMNDYTEVRFGAAVMRAHIDRGYAVEPNPIVCDLFCALRRQLDVIPLASVFVLSFSPTADEVGMWRLYADRGTGFSLCIPAYKLQQPWGGYLIECNYSNDDLDAFCAAALFKPRQVYLEGADAGIMPDPDAYASLFFRNVVWFGPIFKHQVWSDESEWRVVYVRPPEHHKRRESDGRTYIEVPAVEDGRLPIAAICAGLDCDYIDSVAPLQKLMHDCGYGDVPIHVSQHFQLRPGRPAPRLANNDPGRAADLRREESK